MKIDIVERYNEILEKKKLAKAVRLAASLTFLTYRPYLASDLTKKDKVLVYKMFNLKRGYYETYLRFACCSSSIFYFWLDFVIYTDDTVGFDDILGSYEKYILNKDKFNVSELHINRSREVLRVIDNCDIDLFKIADLNDIQSAAATIKIYKKYFDYKRYALRSNDAVDKKYIKQKRIKALIFIAVFAICYLWFIDFVFRFI